ncbi:ABC transporter substrate-binding protein, partial [Janthinobacterium fluminis]|uniref:ABC transporter substrate-binding protein n=1 Tax=Janthinobacterium fluminis TaxID=2987524 RepID=UPI002359C677
MPPRRPPPLRASRRRRLPLWALACALLAGGGAQAAEKVTLQLKWRHQFQFAGYYAAQEQGYYRAAGLDVTLREAVPGSDPVHSVLDGAAQYGVGGSDLLLKRGAGQPLVVLAPIFQHSATALAVRRLDDGSPRRQWAGSRMMIASGDDEIRAYFRARGINLGEVRQVTHSYNFDDLIGGKVDAMTVYLNEAPYVLDRSHIGYDLIAPRQAGIDFYGDNLYTTESELREHPRRVQALRAATLRGWAYAMAHQDEIADLIRARYPDSHSREQLLYEAQHMTALLAQNVTELGHSDPQRWRAIAAAYTTLGMLPADFSLDGFLYQPPRDPALPGYAAALAALLLAGAALWRARRLGRRLAAAEAGLLAASAQAEAAADAAPGAW